MATLAHWLRWIFEAPLRALDPLPVTLALVVASVVTGVAMLWVVKIATRQAALERARDRMVSGIYEIRLFLDSPRHVLGAQGRMVWNSICYVGHLMPAMVFMAIPLVGLYLHMETRFGVAPLPTGEPVVVFLELEPGVDGEQIRPAADQIGVAVTAPHLYDRAEQRIYVRIEVAEPGRPDLAIETPSGLVRKRLHADPAQASVDPERARGAANFWILGHEPALPDQSGLARISVTHPARDQTWLGLGLPWWAFWLILATVAALLLRRPMGVVL